MKNSILLTLIILFFSSCQTKEKEIEGVLFFKLVNILPKEGFSKEKVLEIEKALDTIKPESNKDETTIYLLNLKKHNLLSSPNISIQTQEGIIKVFLPVKEYNKTEKYTLDDLQNRNKKIVIKLKITELENNLYYSEKIISLKEVDGETPWEK